MAEPTCRVVEDSEWALGKSAAMAQEANMRGVRLIDFRGDANVDRAPDYWLHVFNISRASFTVVRPPCFPGIQIKACPEEQPFIEVLAVPNVVNEKWIDAASGEIRVHGMRGERFAMDIVNPSNPGENMWEEIRTSWIDSGGDDLSRRGVFWTRNEVPTAQELQKARLWMERHYRQLIQAAETLSSQNRAREISMEAHLAADHFKLRVPWHMVAEVPVSCPNCGEAIKSGIAFHSNNGMLCVIDWRGAVNAGVVKRQDVPEDRRWWSAPSEPEEETGFPGQSEEEFKAMTEEAPRRGPGRPRKQE